MACGYIHCPCCGYDTVATDAAVPELCSECEVSGCELDGSEPQCDSHDDCEDCDECGARPDSDYAG